jgi:cell division protein FtsL
LTRFLPTKYFKYTKKQDTTEPQNNAFTTIVPVTHPIPSTQEHTKSMTDFSLQVRRLALSPGEKALTSCLTIVAAIAIALLAICLYRRRLANEAAKRAAEQEKNKELAVEILEESTQDSKDEVEDVEVARTESEEEEDYDRSISLCRTGTMNSLDVHACQSGSCDVCRKDEEPDFIQVKKITTGTEGRIRSLQGKWWERDYSEQEPLDSILSLSRSADWENESYLRSDSAVSDS